MGRTVSVAFFSTFKSGGYKSIQIQKMVKAFTEGGIKFKCYSISERLINNSEEVFDVTQTKLPVFVNWIYNKLGLYRIYSSYYNYLLGEYLYYLVFGKRILEDKSDVVILKNRPAQLIKLLKRKSNKYLIVEVDQLHPLYTKKILSQEYERYNIKKDSIYTNKCAISNYILSYELADLLIVYTKFQRDQLISFGIKTDIKIVDLGFENIFPIINNNHDLTGDVIFICLAHHTFVKGTQRLLDAWEYLPTNYILYILGSHGDDMREYLLSKNKNINVFFIEKFNSSELFNFCVGKRIVGISLSLSDSYNRVLSEYLELGLPVIVSEILDRGISENNLGIVVDVFDSNSIVNAVKCLFEIKNYDKLRINNIKYNARNIDNDVNVYGHKYLQIINNLK